MNFAWSALGLYLFTMKQLEGVVAKEVLTQRLVIGATGMVSLVLGEFFFKFGSFSLEVIAFLATWAVLAKFALFLTKS